MVKQNKIIPKEEFPILETDQVFFIAKKIYKNFGELSSGTIKEYAPTPFKAFAIAPRLIGAMRKGEFWKQLNDEIEELANNGRIKDDYYETEQAKACFQEMANAFEDPSLDKEKFEALKNIFLKAFIEENIDRNSNLPQLYMRTVNELSSDEIYFLVKCYKVFLKDEFEHSRGFQSWSRVACEETGFPLGAIYKFEINLVNQGILGERKNTDRSGIDNRETFRLTDFAIDLCKFMLDSPTG